MLLEHRADSIPEDSLDLALIDEELEHFELFLRAAPLCCVCIAPLSVHFVRIVVELLNKVFWQIVVLHFEAVELRLLSDEIKPFRIVVIFLKLIEHPWVA